MNQFNEVKAARLLWVGCLVMCLFCCYRIGSAIYTLQTTALVSIESPHKDTAISIARVNSQGQGVGSGNINIRIPEGTYYVSAAIDGKTASKILKAKPKEHVSVSIDPQEDVVSLPSVDNITFINDALLIKKGLTTSQVLNIKRLFFAYKHTLKTVSFTVATQDDRDRNDTSIWFGVNIAGYLDGLPYTGRIEYTGFDSVALSISDSQGNKIYSGSLPQESSGD